MDVTGEGEVQGANDRGFRDDSNVGIVRGGVDLVVARESISGSEFGTWENLPNDIKVL